MRDAKRLFAARALRAFVDGYIALLLPYYLTLLGYNAPEIGILITATLLGSGAMTLGAGLIAHRYRSRGLLAALSPALAGYMLTVSSFGWPLVVCGALKIVYDLTLLKMFQSVKPPEENVVNSVTRENP